MDKPTPPQDGECCESECSPCVWDRYYEELAAWRRAQAERHAAQSSTPDTEPTSPAHDNGN